MSRAGKIIVWVAAVWFVVFTVEGAHRGSDLLMLFSLVASLFLLGALVTSVVRVFADWRQHRWRAFVPFAVCLFAVVAAVAAIRTARRMIFAWSLPSYEAVVRQMEAGSIPVPDKLTPIPEAQHQARLAWAVLAQKGSDGTLTVEFLTESGFPVKHSGYLYSSSGSLDASEARRWPIRHEEKPKWFYISD